MSTKPTDTSVLILVLMEDALRVLMHNVDRSNIVVLILVLMEDALRVVGECWENK